MTIFSIVSPVFVIPGLERLGGSAAAQPLPFSDLIRAAIATAVWASAVALIAAWLRARERNAARAHIRSIIIGRRDRGEPSGMEPGPMQNRAAGRHPSAKPIQQI